MNAPQPTPFPLPDAPLLSSTGKAGAGSQSGFVAGVISLCENAFRVVGFFIYTALAYGLLSATCHQNPFLWLFVFFLSFLFYLYVWSITVGSFAHRWAQRGRMERSRKRWRRIINGLVISLALMSFVFFSFQSLINTYVLRLFPEARTCDMFQFRVMENEAGKAAPTRSSVAGQSPGGAVTTAPTPSPSGTVAPSPAPSTLPPGAPVVVPSQRSPTAPAQSQPFNLQRLSPQGN